MKKLRIVFTLCLLILILPGFVQQKGDKEFELSKNMDIFHSLMRELDMFYVDETEPGKLIQTGMVEMLKTLDPYTVYIPESQMEDLQLMTTGEYGGLGALISQIEDKVIITDPYEGSPAQRAGLRAGDIITRVEGRSVKGKSSSDISLLMKGNIGTEVSITVFRPHTEKDITVKLTREKIRMDNVPFFARLDDGTGYIRISGFTEGAGEEVRRAFIQLKEKGIHSVILDLRSNPGGILGEAVSIMNVFVPRNQEIVSTKGKVQQWQNTYYTRLEPVDTMIPVAVIVNSGSASASEIVAGAMQDLDRGVVIGQRTFGKGLVQTTRDLSYNSKLKITTAKYYVPSGRCIQALDYSHRREDGSVGRISDSLINQFSTRTGRKVYDGGGIQPDIILDKRVLSQVATSLLYQNKYFDYATRYRNLNEQVLSVERFRIDDVIWTDFVNFLKVSEFSYKTGSEEAIQKLIEVAKIEKYFDQSRELFDALGQGLEHNLDKDMNRFRDEISDLLGEEIISRYLFQQGRIGLMIRDDEPIRKASAVLQDLVAYRNLLNI